MAPKEPISTEEGQAAEAVSSPTKKRKSTSQPEIEVDLNLPEPPSKKARRALKKGKTLPAKPQSSDDEADDEDGEKKDGDAKATKKKERSPYGVWIGNLRFTITKTELRKWLVDNSGGAITDDAITRVHMPTTKPAAGVPKTKTAFENRGFAYVDFATFEANVAAIALSETELLGRKLLIKDSKNFDGRPKKEAAEEDGDNDKEKGTTGVTEAPKKNPSTKIFVGNLSFQVTEDDLREHFEKCGKIRWIKVATFEDSGKCKGYGWVNFEEAEAAAWAVKGFVKIKEKIDTLEDFMDEGDKTTEDQAGVDENGTGEQEKKKKPKAADDAQPRVKTRKWWVNQLYGRPLKIELAEDDQTRYNKRFRGKGQQKQQRGGDLAPTGGASGASDGGQRNSHVKEKKDISVSNDISVARLTGAPVAHQGKKTTFD